LNHLILFFYFVASVTINDIHPGCENAETQKLVRMLR